MSEKKQSEWPGLATHLSWVMHLDEEKALEATEILKQWEDPAEGAAAFNRCESPAERLFLLGFLLQSEPRLGLKWDSDDDNCVAAIENTETEEELVLWQQIEVGKYRCDFVLSSNDAPDQELRYRESGKVVVEIDGHDFHERTKEQAASDRQRDRALARSGLTVIRFTGAEIYKAPAACAREAWHIANAQNEHEMATSQHEWMRGFDCGREYEHVKLGCDFRKGFYAGRSLQRRLKRPERIQKHLRLVKGNAA